MSDELITLEVVDVDGAIRESADALEGGTRGDFFKKAAVGGGSLLAGGVLFGGLPSIASAATRKSKSNDIKILNYALTLEYLESTFYNQAVGNKALSGDTLAAAVIVQEHENAHVKALKKVLGHKAIKKPKFEFGATTTDPSKFLQTAVALENTGVAAYSGQAGNIFEAKVLAAAVSILTVEARHASRFNSLAGERFAPSSFDKPESMSKVLSIVKKTGFIVK